MRSVTVVNGISSRRLWVCRLLQQDPMLHEIPETAFRDSDEVRRRAIFKVVACQRWAGRRLVIVPRPRDPSRLQDSRLSCQCIIEHTTHESNGYTVTRSD